MNILFVCTGNTCRSPMAEAMLESKTNKFKTKSAGIYASPGSPVSNGTKEVLSDANIKLDHASKQVTQKLIDWADVVLTMTHEHKQLLRKEFPSNQSKYYTLKEYNKADEERALNHYFLALKNLKEKQALFKEPSENFKTELAREVAITEFVKEELTKVREIEQELSKENVQDPFGQSKQVYEKTYQELKLELNKLISRGG